MIRRIIETLERRRLLNESLGTVYHTTRHQALVSILETGQFRFSRAHHGELSRTIEAINKTYTYFMSFSRSKHGGYNRGEQGNVTLVVDFDWLRSKVRFVPIDYIGDRKSPINETEERALSNTQYLKLPAAIKDVIHEIHLWISYSDYATTKEFMKMMALIKRHRIPYYVYTDRVAWYLQRKDKATQSVSNYITSFISTSKHDKEFRDEFGDEIGDGFGVGASSSYVQREKRQSWKQGQNTKVWLELYHQTDMNKLSPQAKAIVEKYIMRGPVHALKIKFNSDLSLNKPENEYYEKLFKIVRKMKKTYDLEEVDNFVLYLFNKWSRILEATSKA